MAAWALLLVPIAARAVLEMRPSPKVLRHERIVALLLAILVPSALSWTTFRHDHERGFGVGLSRDYYPVDATLLLQRSGAAGKLFNEYNDGGWLALHLAPRVTISIDSRTPNYYDAEH